MASAPLASEIHATPAAGPATFTAARKLSRVAGSRAESVSVPGVTMRVTLRSTGPLEAAGSPTCSQMATDSPSFTSLARYCSTACQGTPAMRIGDARGLAARGEREVEQLRGALGIPVEHLVEVAHAIEEQHVGMLALQGQVLLHHRGVLRRGRFELHGPNCKSFPAGNRPRRRCRTR